MTRSQMPDISGLAAAVAEEKRKRTEARLRASLGEFFRASWHVLEPSTPLADNWHIDALCTHLQAVFAAWLTRRGLDTGLPTPDPTLQNVLFNIPPGTSKSRIVSVVFNAWAWLHCPSFCVTAFSSNPNVALRDADFVRALIEDPWFKETFKINWSLRADKTAVGSFQICRLRTNKKTGHVSEQLLGKRRSMGMSAKITGERSDCIIVDDPHDANEVFSNARRQEVLNKWDNAICNRTNDANGTIRIGVMQRLHPGDWSSHVLSQKSQNWLLVGIPLEYEPGSTFAQPTKIGFVDPRTEKGELLHAVRFPKSFVAAEKERLGSFCYSAQYNQCPIDLNSGILRASWFRWFRFADTPPSVGKRPHGTSESDTRVLMLRGRNLDTYFDSVHVSIDANFKKTESGSEVGVLVIATIDSDFFIVEDLTRAAGFVETKELIRKLQAKYKPDSVIIEDKANGSAIIDDLRNEFSNLVSVEPDGGKEARAHAIAPIVESGHVFVLEDAPWVSAFLTGPDSVPAFPTGGRNDRIDTLTQALTKLKNRGNLLSRYASLSMM